MNIPFKTPPFGYFPRPAFTEVVRAHLSLPENIALFAPRRRGKTTWVLLELQEAAAAWRMGFIYINLWKRRTDPIGVLVEGLEDAAGIKVAPDRELYGEIAAGIFTAGGKIKYPPVTSAETTRLSNAMTVIAKARPKTLLVIDEFQAISEADPGQGATSALRTSLEHHGDQILAMLTGSERTALTALFKRQQAALLGQARMLELPDLGKEFIANRVEGFRLSTHRVLDNDALAAAYERLGQSPMLLNDALGMMTVHRDLPLEEAVQTTIDTKGTEDFRVALAGIAALDRALLRRIAAGEAVYSDLDGLLARGAEKTPTRALVQKALGRLQKGALIEQKESGQGWVLADPMLKEALRRGSPHHHTGIDGDRDGVGCE